MSASFLSPKTRAWMGFWVVFLVLSVSPAGIAFAQEAPAYSYQNEFSTGEEAARVFGIPPTHNRTDPGINAGGFNFELGTSIDCGKIDIKANINGQLNEIKEQLKSILPKDLPTAKDYIAKSAFVGICYAYPTACAQIRNDYLSLQGKLNLRAQACAAIDKFIDNQAEKGSRQLKSEAVAKCVKETVGTRVSNNKLDGVYDVSMALKVCQDKSGLAMRDFQTGLMRNFGNEKQKVLKSLLSFAKDETSYDLLSSFLGEIQINHTGQWEPLFEKGLLRPADVADAFLTSGQNLSCNRLKDVFANPPKITSPSPYESEAVSILRRKVGSSIIDDFEVLSPGDRNLVCRALGRSVGREAALVTSAKSESLVSTGLLNTAIPEPLRAEYRERSLAAFPALRASLESEDIAPVEVIRAEIRKFADLQRAKTKLLATEANRARLQNKIRDEGTQCTDSLSCP
jgi:hypothetical protein